MSSKQDRHGVRTAVDLERKYSFKKQFTSFNESVNTNSNDISELSARTQYGLESLSQKTDAQFDKTNTNVTNLTADVRELESNLQNMTNGFTFIVDGVVTGDANNSNRIVIDGDEVRVYVNDNLMQTFNGAGIVSVPVLNVTAMMTLLGLQVEETTTNINCYYGGEIVWSFLKRGGEIVGVAFGKVADEEVFDVAFPMKNPSVDTVVEEGESNGWTFRKWNSGLAECWMSLEHSTALSTAWGALYSGTATTRQNYPFTFTERPNESVSLMAETYQGLLFPEKNLLGANTVSQTACYNICRPSSITTASKFYFNFYVVGRWK